jgi:hypothetical protein
MGSVSTHTASFLGGSTVAAAVLGILIASFHMDAALATDWMIVISAIVGGPVLAYLGVKAKSDPALAAALDAITAMAHQNGEQAPTEPAPAPVVAVVVPPALIPAAQLAPVAPPPAVPPALANPPQ